MMLSCCNKVFERERHAFTTKTCLFPCSSGPFCFSVHHRALRSNAIQITLQLHKPSHSSLFTSIERKCALRFLVFHYMSVSIYLAFAFIRCCSGRHFIHPYLVASSILLPRLRRLIAALLCSFLATSISGMGLQHW